MPTNRRRSQGGFTLQEMLLVIAISVVLLALSVVGVVGYMRQLQLAELDNAAREIFLAAQNRSILLSGGQRLEGLVVRTNNRLDHIDVLPGSLETTQITAYYIRCNDEKISQLLPAETIDPTLWEGDFYIVYEPESGSVVDVFFSDDTLPVNGDFPGFYSNWRAADKSARMDSKPMIGYYGGESAQSGTAISLRTPVINIYNENDLKAEVTYWVPRTLSMAGGVQLTTTLTYQGHPFSLSVTDPDDYVETPGVAYIAHTYTWILDSLEGERFQDRFSIPGVSLPYGGDFTLDAEVSYTGSGDLKVNGARKTATDNSLFAKDSGGGTAYLTCLRHLQNLDSDFSGVSGKSQAVQRGEILGVEGYTFQPIENGELKSYDGGEFPIYGLTITADGATPAGLFGTFSGTDTAPGTLNNIRLANTAVSAGSGPVGTLVGQGAHLEFSNCQVYWENRSEQATNLRGVLVDSDNNFLYQVTGSGPAGGLAGSLTDAALNNCSASTLVTSGGPAGGLVGQAAGLTVTGSYASSYLQGSRAAGLVGELMGNGTTISGSYAVGFIDSTGVGATAAGLCLGDKVARVERSYSAMLFTSDSSVTNYPLCETGDPADYVSTYYLESDQFHFMPGNESRARAYSVLTDSSQWSALFGTDVFAFKGTALTHPYNLQTALFLTAFNFPGVAALDHWGDWGAQFQKGSLVYYEQYTDGTYGFNGELSHLATDGIVVNDGYAVIYRGTDFNSALGITLTIATYPSGADADPVEQTKFYPSSEIYKVEGVKDVTGATDVYYLVPLPEELVNTDHTTEDFYQKITISDPESRTYYYNPHFANPVLREENGKNPVSSVAQLQVIVRSPRHLYNLSKYAAYYASGNQYRFVQQLDLSYGQYKGYGLFTGDWSQDPIGLSASSPFRGSYYGNCHTITGVTAAPGGNAYVGLFGYNTGVLQNVVYNMENAPALAVTRSGSDSSILYAGALVGYNGGTVTNCAVSGVRIQAQCYNFSTIYLGGLAGLNAGTIRSSAAEVAELTAEANLSNAYAGGFVGRNAAGSSISQCYAVGKVSVTRARVGTVYACGFAGRNESTLSRSYAAVSLTAAGEAVRYGFCPDSTTGCVFLNDGNFTYRGEHYAAQYDDRAAQPVTWAQLAGEEENSAVTALGMDTSGQAAPYPYPAAVTDSSGNPVHYGQWPDRMELGIMGVYYWEKLTIGSTVSYHLSAISISSDGQVMKSSTLSTAHGDGGVISEYGYGYFYEAGDSAPTLLSSGIGYKKNEPFHFQAEAENAQANAELSKLMGQHYTFHSYNTWGTKTADAGLHTTASGVNGQPPYGAWSLDGSFSVRLNPFFANSMAQGADPLPGTAGNPYEVRSIDQLQFINWNSNAMNTVRRMDITNKHLFPYLCYGANGYWTLRSFCWEQTHDLEGSADETHTPIAGVYDASVTGKEGGDLFGWFGGTYDGNDYVIADVNIAPYSSNSNDATSCVGLFGAVYNGTLKNIVLYSEDGTATVTGTNSGTSQWYVIGGLAGLAGSSTGSAVLNCTVSGYQILDTHKSNVSDGWGGTGVGGLIGICHMDLTNCTAVTDIYIDSKNSDNVRIGGLVGSCQGSISSCYTGGSIQVTSRTTVPNDEKYYNMYVGGIVGGIYMKPLRVGGSNSYKVGRSGDDLTNTLNNCYTYTELPAVSSNTRIKGLYAVGGSGELDWSSGNMNDHGGTNYYNNYYLESVVLTNNDIWAVRTKRNDLNQVTGLSYEKMADKTSIDGLLYLLNANSGNFSTVTTETADKEPLNGRYSFGNDPSLLGLDYPFPTILTQSSDVAEGGTANVHYGDWPLEGIVRPDGALPVSLDLFANYNPDVGKAIKEEHLSLSPGIAQQGAWSADSSAPDVATATVAQDGKLVITAHKAGSTVVTVSYSNTPNKLNIQVNVTAELRLAAVSGPVKALTGGTVAADLVLLDRNGEPLHEDLRDDVSLTTPTVEFDPDYFSNPVVTTEGGLTLTAETGGTVGQSQMTVGYNFTYLQNTYPTTSVLTLQIWKPKVELQPMEFTFAQDTVMEQTQDYTGQGGFTLELAEDEPENITGLQILDYKLDADFSQTLFAEWAKDADGNKIPGTLSITAYPQSYYPAVASVQVQYQFTWEGNTHTLWQELPVQLKKEPEEPPEEELP